MDCRRISVDGGLSKPRGSGGRLPYADDGIYAGRFVRNHNDQFSGRFYVDFDPHLNWGSSYLINDFYKQFIQPKADDPHDVSVSRLCVVLFTVCAGVVSLFMNSISGAWKFLIALNAGIGLVQISRWYWWCIVFS